MKLVKTIMSKNYIWLPMITLFCLAGFIGSYLVPNRVLDTYLVNVTEDTKEEVSTAFLEKDKYLCYEFSTNNVGNLTDQFEGIQVWVDKNGQSFETGTLLYDVYLRNEEESAADYLKREPISKNQYSLQTVSDGQDVFLPVLQASECKGMLAIVFSYVDSSGNYDKVPGLLMNQQLNTKNSTRYAGEEEQGALKAKYVYARDSYPFLYDFRILTFVFLAVTMTCQFPFHKKAKGDAEHEK